MSDRVVSWIRTIVPVLWGSLIAWAFRTFDWLEGALEYLHLDPHDPALIAGLTVAAIGAWYALVRWAEPRLPEWVTRIVLGSAREPEYGPARGRHVA